MGFEVLLKVQSLSPKKKKKVTNAILKQNTHKKEKKKKNCSRTEQIQLK